MPSPDGKGCKFMTQKFNRDLHTQAVSVAFDKVRSMVDDGHQGAYIHYQPEQRWKLGHIKENRTVVQHFCDCPRNSEILSDGRGGVWIWKKKIGNYNLRGIVYVNNEGQLKELNDKFDGTSKRA